LASTVATPFEVDGFGKAQLDIGASKGTFLYPGPTARSVPAFPNLSAPPPAPPIPEGQLGRPPESTSLGEAVRNYPVVADGTAALQARITRDMQAAAMVVADNILRAGTWPRGYGDLTEIRNRFSDGTGDVSDFEALFRVASGRSGVTLTARVT